MTDVLSTVLVVLGCIAAIALFGLAGYGVARLVKPDPLDVSLNRMASELEDLEFLLRCTKEELNRVAEQLETND